MHSIKRFLSLLVMPLLLTAFISSEEKPAYIIYSKDGNQIHYSQLVEKLLRTDLIFFGESHNDPIAHWLQHELIRDLAADDSRRTHIGMEMFEADQQLLIDEYFMGLISQSSFESEARLWNNYSTDYKPIVEFAREEGINVIATNIPRRYASSVFHGGMEALQPLGNMARQWIAPLPIDVDLSLPGYSNIAEAAGGHGGDNLIYAQAVKDATMAYFILLNMKLDDQMFHLNGSYHSNHWEGIIWYIEEAVKGYQIMTINTIHAEDIEKVDLEELQAADFTVVVASRMTRTY